jgi:hypothetical protein
VCSRAEEAEEEEEEEEDVEVEVRRRAQEVVRPAQAAEGARSH